MFIKRRVIFRSALIISILIGTSISAKEDVFKVDLTAPKRKIITHQKKVELQLARNTQFCRGFHIPSPVSKWTCQSSSKSKNKQTCSIKYQCKNVNKNFNRLTETKKLSRELKKLPRTTSLSQVVVHKDSLLKKIRKDIKKNNSDKIANSYAYKKEKSRKTRRRRKEINRKVKKDVQNYDEFTEIERELGISKENKVRKRRAQKREFERMSANELNEDKKQAGQLKADYIMESKESRDGKEQIIKIKRKNQKEDKNKRNVLWAFSGALTRITDNLENSSASTDIAWIPRWSFSDNWRLRPHLGGHFIKAFINGTSETFLVIDYAAFLEYRLWGHLYVDIGTGFQFWNSSDAQSYGAFIMGASYEIISNKIPLIDRLFTSWSNIANDDKHTEFKFGLGISF
jgi:hypothetical protein